MLFVLGLNCQANVVMAANATLPSVVIITSLEKLIKQSGISIKYFEFHCGKKKGKLYQDNWKTNNQQVQQ